MPLIFEVTRVSNQIQVVIEDRWSKCEYELDTFQNTNVTFSKDLGEEHTDLGCLLYILYIHHLLRNCLSDCHPITAEFI